MKKNTVLKITKYIQSVISAFRGMQMTSTPNIFPECMDADDRTRILPTGLFVAVTGINGSLGFDPSAYFLSFGYFFDLNFDVFFMYNLFYYKTFHPL